jgi:hypothetical protein
LIKHRIPDLISFKLINNNELAIHASNEISEDGMFIIYNLNGQSLMKEKVNAGLNNYSLGKFSTGIYVFYVQYGNSVIREKLFIKNE